jgi:cobyrinic acid a,c-diamide synthase
MSRIPRLVIAGTHSGAGKTTVATAIMAALTRRGMRVQPFKVGPDFIDPTFHKAATGRISRNLDGWMLSRESNLRGFARACRDADVAVVEGVMGLFDGRDGTSDAGSTAELAKWLNAPVVLVMDASAMARSAAAVVHGFESFDPKLDLAGVLFNRVSGKGHFEFLRTSVAAACKATPLGFLSRNDDISFPERHLGLVLADEVLTSDRLIALADWMEATVDLDRLLEIASRAPVVSAEVPDAPRQFAALEHQPRIGIARDRAFCFYYQDNLDLLKDCGAELVEFSPIADVALPDRLDGMYLGGGYPELHARELAANESMRQAIREFARSGAPVYAECGGLMYLTEAIVGMDGQSHSMVGIFPTRVRMQPQLAAIGYVEVEELNGSGWLCSGERARGHEFRYSTIEEMPEQIARSYRLVSNRGTRVEGFTTGSVLGSYVHLHFASCPQFAERFVLRCSEHRSNKKPIFTT